jgi:hypothetical protein
MSDFAPSFPLFIGSVVFLGYCIYCLIFKKQAVKGYNNTAKLLFYTLLVTTSVIFVWGLVFLLLYWFT